MITVGYHAPLPPAATGVADYAAALLDALRAFCDVRPHAEEAAVHLYQLGNNQLHRAIHARALGVPGVALKTSNSSLNSTAPGSADWPSRYGIRVPIPQRTTATSAIRCLARLREW